MRIVFFTRADCQSDALFVYMHAQVARHFHDVHIVAVRPQLSKVQALSATLSRYRNKVQRLGMLNTLEILSSYPLQLFFASQDQATVGRLLRNLPRPAVEFNQDRIVYVSTVNGPDALQAMRSLAPDLIIQAGAGILRPRLFKLPRFGTLNLHHGMAPLIRGMDSIYWGLWEKRPDWLGATVHWIDEGIDTGAILAYAPVASLFPGENYPALFARATAQGIDRLVETITRLAAGEQWAVPAIGNTSVYRSTMSGWKHTALCLRLTLQRMGQGSRAIRTRKPAE
jgi:methionyl-tRNA formyltransferase